MKQLPKVTMFVYAYNHEKFIKKAIDAAFSQTYTNMEIILSDDNSTDRTFEVMRKMSLSYNGPHKIILNKNERNLGISGHLNKIMTLGTGDWFVLAAGDDISMPNRVEMIMDKIRDNPEIMSINTGFDVIDQRGNYLKYSGFDINHIYITGASGAWNRKVFDFFGPISKPTTAEDVVIPFRALLLGKLFLLNKATIFYREHDNSVSNPLNTNYLEAQKHLKKICHQLVNACEQRLLDLDKIENEISETLHTSLKRKQQKIITILKKRIENIEVTIDVFESSLFGKIKYLFTTSSLNKHNSIIRRLKNVLLSYQLIDILNIKLRKSGSMKKHVEYKEDILLDVSQLNNQKDLLIYL